MIKRIVVIIIITTIAVVGAIFFNSSLDKDTTDKHADRQSNKSLSGNENKKIRKDTQSLDSIFNLAKHGKIPGFTIVVGETTADELQKYLGKPNGTSDTKVGHFLNYPLDGIDVGMTNNIVYDVRSSQDQITALDLDSIKSYKKPDELHYYRDENNDQIILVYKLSDDYVLKWVLPNPTDDSDNPVVHHISLSKEINRDSVNEENNDGFVERENRSISLDEKIGQMIFSGVNGTKMTAETKNIIKSYHVGGIILFGNNIKGIAQTVNFMNELKTANVENPYPLLLGVDEEGGSVTRMPKGMKSLPSSSSIGALNDPDVSFNVGTILGMQLKGLGFNLDFAPVLDVNSNPNNPIIGDRSFGDNSNIVTRLGIQTMKGIQNEGVISVMKHFPGHGDTGVDSHFELPEVNKSYQNLSELELVPFKKAISEGADVSMVAHILLPKIDETYPASMSKQVIIHILRDDYNFNGIVITDDLTMEAITDHFNVADAAVQSVKAGADLLLVAHDPNLIAKVFENLKAAVESGEISEDRIDESVERIRNLKMKYELSDERTPIPNVKRINAKVEDILQKAS